MQEKLVTFDIFLSNQMLLKYVKCFNLKINNEIGIKGQ